MKLNNGGEAMKIAFRGVLRAILDFLEHGEVERAIRYIQDILNDRD